MPSNGVSYAKTYHTLHDHFWLLSTFDKPTPKGQKVKFETEDRLDLLTSKRYLKWTSHESSDFILLSAQKKGTDLETFLIEAQDRWQQLQLPSCRDHKHLVGVAPLDRDASFMHLMRWLIWLLIDSLVDESPENRLIAKYGTKKLINISTLLEYVVDDMITEDKFRLIHQLRIHVPIYDIGAEEDDRVARLFIQDLKECQRKFTVAEKQIRFRPYRPRLKVLVVCEVGETGADGDMVREAAELGEEDIVYL